MWQVRLLHKKLLHIFAHFEVEWVGGEFRNPYLGNCQILTLCLLSVRISCIFLTCTEDSNFITLEFQVATLPSF